MVCETAEKIAIIKDHLRTTQSKQKSYVDCRRRELEFQVGDKVLLKNSPTKGVVRFRRKSGKLSPRFIGPFKILERVRRVGYCLALPLNLSRIHDVFHISMLRKYVHDESHIIDYSDIKLREKVTYPGRPFRILDHRTKQLQNKEIGLVKKQWNHHDENEASWELESEMREKYPEIFTKYVR